MAKESMLSKILSKLSGANQERPAEDLRSERPVLKMVVFIVDWEKANAITDILDEKKVRFHFVTRGRGTASSEILNLLGIGASDKAMIICMEQGILIPVLMREARKKLGFYNPGTGIAFAVPLSAINDPVLRVFKQSVIEQVISADADHARSEGGDMAHDVSHESSHKTVRETEEITHDLVVAIVNQGYCDELMNTAREAGASGGTVINARGQAHEGTVKFFGVSVQAEKELILILTSRESKVPLMRAICETHGLNSKAHGIIFSLPVDSVMGLSFD